MNRRAKNKSTWYQTLFRDPGFGGMLLATWVRARFWEFVPSVDGHRVRKVNQVEAIDGGVSARVRGVFRSIAFMIFTATSAYLVLELVIALSAQGEPTGAVAPFTGAEVIYPEWYQAPEFLDAAWVALVAYPAAGVFYGIGTVAGWIRRSAMAEQPRLPSDMFELDRADGQDAAVLPAAEPIDDLCLVSADRRIQHIAPGTARLFGLTPGDMMGRSLEAFLSPVDLPKLDALVAAAYADQPRAFATTIGILLPEAIVAAVDITCRAIVDHEMAGPGATIITIKPLSERGRLDDQLAALWY
jgi:PAS domain-containing protein